MVVKGKEAMIMCYLEASTILLNICIDLMMLSTMSEEMGRLVSLMKYGIPRTLR